MKTNHFFRALLTLTVLSSMFSPRIVLALPFVHADVQMSNVQWAPQAGSLTWLTDWELNASAFAFDDVNGFFGESNSGGGQPATVSANALGGFSSAFAEVSVDASGEVLALESAMDLSFPPGVFVSAFSATSAYREFMITGGTGPVPVTLSFDYLAHLQGNAPNQGADFKAFVSIASESESFDLAYLSSGIGIMDQTFSGTANDTFLLEYGVIYGFTSQTSDDYITQIPEGGPGPLLTGLVFLALLAFGRRSYTKRRGAEENVPRLIRSGLPKIARLS